VFVARIIEALFCWESGIRHFGTKGGGRFSRSIG
jgi:hypothetical protein